MTQEQFSTLVKGMKAMYPDPKFIADKYAADLWYQMLSDLPYEIANAAVQKHILTSSFPPTVADIRKAATALTTPQEQNAEEAWSRAKLAIRNGIYHAEEEFAELPEAVQRAIGSPDNLRNMAMMDSEDLNTVEKSHFIRTYNVELTKSRENALMPERMKALIEKTLERLPG